MNPFRRNLWLSLLLTVTMVGAPGCSVLEVIQNMGVEETPKKTAKADESADSPATSAEAKLKAYYNREPKKVKKDPMNPIVRCRAGGSTSYLRREDCQLRGGTEEA